MLKQKFALSYISKIALQFIQLIVTIFVARIVGPSVLGTIAFGLAFVNMFVFISDLGIPTAYIKSINDGVDEKAANGTFIRIQVLLIIFFIISVFGWYLIQKYYYLYKFESKDHEIVILLFIVIVAIQRFYRIIKVMFIARTQQAKQDIPDIIYTILYQSIRLIVVLIGYKAVAIVTSNLVATIFLFPLYIYLLKPFVFGKFDKDLAKRYFSISIPLIIILISQTLLSQSDKVLLQYYTNSTQVGYYTAGFRVGGFVQMIANVIGLLFFPLFTKAIAENDISFINSKIEKFERFMFSFIFPVTVFVAIFSKEIVIFILGDQYLPTTPILAIITISMFLLTFFQPYGNIILAKGKFYLASFIFLIQLAVFLILAYIVISPSYFDGGGKGLALVVLFANILTGIFFVIFSKRNLFKLNTLPSKLSIIYGISYSAIFYFLYLLMPDLLLVKILSVIVFFSGYWSIGYFLKIIHKSEWNMALGLMNFKKMGTYISSEFKGKNENN